MPPLPWNVEPLVGYLLEMGPREGDSAATWGQLRNWQEATGTQLDAWQSKALIEMARAYVGESYEAMEPDAPPPFLKVKPKTVEQKQQLATSLKAALRRAAAPAARAKNQGKK